MAQDFNISEPSPLSPQPFSPPSTRPAVGCSRYALIGCGLLTLLLGIGAVVFLIKARDLFDWAMTNFEAQVIESLPEDVTEEERRRLSRAFAAASDAVQEGRADASALQQLQEELREMVLQEGRRLSREDLSRLITVLEQVAAEDQNRQPGETDLHLNPSQESPAPASAQN